MRSDQPATSVTHHGLRGWLPFSRLPVGARRFRATTLVATVLALVIATLAFGIARSQEQARSHILATFALRGTSSATFVSAFLAEQADRERDTATKFLSGSRVSSERFRMVVATFGSGAAVLLDAGGRVLGVVPSAPSLLGKPIASRYAHLSTAERGLTAVSNIVASAVQHFPVAAIAVPFQTPAGRRVFSAAYTSSGSALGAFVEHTIPYSEHEVYLVDGSGQLVAASPKTAARRLSEADPALARSIEHSTLGAVSGDTTPTNFTVAPVQGTSWRLVIGVPNSRLFASISGWTQVIPWLVFALVSLLAVLFAVVFARLMALSERMTNTARTDSLTGLLNRRALNEHLARISAHARRSAQPMSVLMIDLDRFKQTNDRFGHAAGDEVLCAVADCMRDVLRGGDVYGRWGGDEFVVVLPAATEDEAKTAAARLRETASRVELAGIGLPNGVLMSIGIATSAHSTPEQIIQAADLALYANKAARTRARPDRANGFSPTPRADDTGQATRSLTA